LFYWSIAVAHWRDSARNVRLWMVDFRACFPLMIFIFHISWFTFALAMVTIIFFGALERYGFTVAVFLRWLRSFLAGPRKVSQPWWKK
jgi:intracellular multiplication protein IcmT